MHEEPSNSSNPNELSGVNDGEHNKQDRELNRETAKVMTAGTTYEFAVPIGDIKTAVYVKWDRKSEEHIFAVAGKDGKTVSFSVFLGKDVVCHPDDSFITQGQAQKMEEWKNRFLSLERRFLGEQEQVIVDSNLTYEQALRQNPESVCPTEILQEQLVIPVPYWSFDNKLHRGQLVIHADLVGDMERIFEKMLAENFPLRSVIPAAHEKFRWNDDAMMAANNSSSYNYRTKPNKPKELSYHALGRAIDFNTFLNPYIPESGEVFPPGATYDVSKRGTIGPDSFLVRTFLELGWEWGGRWEDKKDYQHFEKPLKKPEPSV